MSSASTSRKKKTFPRFYFFVLLEKSKNEYFPARRGPEPPLRHSVTAGEDMEVEIRFRTVGKDTGKHFLLFVLDLLVEFQRVLIVCLFYYLSIFYACINNFFWSSLEIQSCHVALGVVFMNFEAFISYFDRTQMFVPRG